MKRLLQVAIGCLCMYTTSAQSVFTGGNLVVLQTTTTISKSGSPATLKEFTTGGAAGITVSLPSVGPTPYQTAGVYGGSEGFLTTSTNGRYLVLAGYATAGTFTDVTATTASSVPRTVGLVYPSGFYLQYDTSNTFYSANDIRGAISDGTNFWASGASNASIDGIDYFGPGSKTAITTSAVPPKAYGLRIFNGQIYYSTQKAGPTNSTSQLGIFALGSGLPTSGNPAVSQVINTGTVIPQDFSFNATSDVCYVAISQNNAAGGIQKWTRSGATWTLAYTLGTGVTNIGAYGLVVDYAGAFPIVYATTFETAGNRVIKIVDNGAGATATTIVNAATNVFYKGISFAPVTTGNPIVNISVDKDTASEAGVSVVTVTANVSEPVVGNQNVVINVTGAGITTGDYTLSNTTISIPGGATSGSVTFNVINDILGEGTERATVNIISSSAGLTLGRRISQGITITDNDGNNVPIIVMKTPTTTNFIDGGVSTSPASPFKMSGVINDPTDPGKTLGVNFKVGDLETAAVGLTVTVRSSNTTVVPAANLSLTGSDSIRTLKITPATVGYSNITVKVSDGTDSAQYVINYAASANSSTPSTTTWHTGISDASDAVMIDDNYFITGDDELDVLNVYSRSASGLPLVSFDYASYLALPNPGSPEVDIEASAVSASNPGKVYWLGSMSNGKAPFDNKPNRDRIFATTYTGTGASTTFTFGGYATLRSSLLSWGDANGYNFTACAAAGVDSKSPSGFAAEGLVFGPDNTTLYVGFRAPLVPNVSRTKAVIAPITGFETWFNNGAPSGSPTIGLPIELNLGGRGIRDIIRLTNGTYVILAGSATGTLSGAIYKWTGNREDAPIPVVCPAAATMNLEGVAQVNTTGVLSTTSLQVITDAGEEVFYGDGTVAKDFGDLIYRKFNSDILSALDLTYPEIGLQGNSIDIANGNVVTSLGNNTDFGNLTAGTTVSKSFTIRNTGTASLTITGISFTGTNAGEFALGGSPTFPLTIPANSSSVINVALTPNSGVSNAMLNIFSNDYDEATYTAAIRGNGVCSVGTIAGNVPLCTGNTLTLTNAGIGTWMSNNTTVATIGSASGVVTGITVGNANITYLMPTGCFATTGVTVNLTPAPITGIASFCSGSTSALANLTSGGVWSSSSLTVATVVSGTGLVSGVSAGNATITYTLNGCSSVKPITINPLPAPITGSTVMCLPANVPLGETLAGGIWTSSNIAVATIGSADGIVTTMGVGSSTITNTSVFGCVASISITVQPTPVAAPVNDGAICIGGTVNLTANGAGGAVNYSWSGTGLTSETIANTTALPTATTIYSLTVSSSTNPGCSPATVYTTEVTVNPKPVASPSNDGPICVGGTAHLLANPTGGVGAYIYSWTDPSSFITTAENPIVTPGTTSTYSLTVRNAASGCSSGIVYTTAVVVYPVPFATASNDGPICVDGTVNLNASASGGIGAYSFEWTGSDLTSTTGASTSASPAASTSYSVVVSNTASGCTSLPATTAVNVNAKPTAAPTGSGPICEGGTLNLNANATGGTGAYVYTWSGAGLATTTVSNPTATPIVSGTYSVTVSNAASGCSAGIVYTTPVAVYSKPIAAPGNDGAICTGGTVNLTSNPAGGIGSYSYVWSGSSLASITAANPTAAPSTSNVYTVVVSNTASGCTSLPYTTHVMVVPKPRAVPVSNGPICIGGTVNLSAHAADGVGSYLYTWSGPGLSSTTAANPTAAPTGTSTYSLSVSNAVSGCSSSIVYTTTATVAPKPTAAPTNNGSICLGDAVTLKANASGGTGAYLYTWSGPSLAGANTAVTNASPTASATYSVTVRNAASGCSNGIGYTTYVRVDTLFEPSVTITGRSVVKYGQNDTLVAVVSNGGRGVTYQWLSGETFIADATSSSFILKNVSKNDSISCFVTSHSPCGSYTGTASKVINVINVGVEDAGLRGSNLILSPNPNKGAFMLNGELGNVAAQDLAITVTNLLGQVVYSDRAALRNGVLHQAVQLDNNIASGVYLLNISSQEGNKVIHFVVE